jgi:hypothetical protein
VSEVAESPCFRLAGSEARGPGNRPAGEPETGAVFSRPEGW